MASVRYFLMPLATVLLLAACAARELQPPPAPAAEPTLKPKVALVLGAGAARGFAHIGVIKVLEAHNVPVDIIVGTSAGSFVGCLHAYGYDGFKLQEIALSVERSDIADLTIFGNGFIKGERLEAYVNKAVSNTPIEKFRVPFAAIATDIQSGEEVVLRTGNAGAAVRASASIPGIFYPAPVGDRMFVDGGIVSPVAVDAARQMGADIIIAVDISSDSSTTRPKGMVETILQAVDIMYSKLSSGQLKKADIAIRPKVGHVSSADFTKRHEAIMEGERAALAALPAIQNAIESRGLQQAASPAR